MESKTPSYHNGPKHQKCFLPLSLGSDGGRLAVCTSKGVCRILHLGHSANQEWKMQKRSKTQGAEFVVSLMVSDGVFLENPSLHIHHWPIATCCRDGAEKEEATLLGKSAQSSPKGSPATQETLGSFEPDWKQLRKCRKGLGDRL